MFEISALTDHDFTPSSRFRIRLLSSFLGANDLVSIADFQRKYSSQLAGNFLPAYRLRNNPFKLSLAIYYESLNIFNTFLRVKAANKCDAIFVSRELLIGYPSFEFILNDNLIYDIDDAVFLRGKLFAFGINKLINRASLIFAGNEYLKSYCSQFNKNVVVLPTPVNTKLFKPCDVKAELDRFVVGWSGTSSSFNYIAAIEDDLLVFFKSHPSSLFKIVADRFPFELTKLLPYINFKKWSVESEVQSIQSFSVGIMPIEKNEWARGKCSYKMLMYMSCAIPVVVTDFGMNAEVLNKGKVGIGCWKSRDWSEALSFLFQNKYSLRDLYPDSRRVVQENYSVEVIADVFINSIKKTFKL